MKMMAYRKGRARFRPHFIVEGQSNIHGKKSHTESAHPGGQIFFHRLGGGDGQGHAGQEGEGGGHQNHQQHKGVLGPHHCPAAQGQSHGIPVPFGQIVIGKGGHGQDHDNDLDKSGDE